MFWTLRNGEVRGGPDPWEGTFFTFFWGSVRAPNPSPALAPREWPWEGCHRGPGPRPWHDRERIRGDSELVRHREHRGHSLTFRTRPCAIGDRIEARQVGFDMA